MGGGLFGTRAAGEAKKKANGEEKSPRSESRRRYQQTLPPPSVILLEGESGGHLDLSLFVCRDISRGSARKTRTISFYLCRSVRHTPYCCSHTARANSKKSSNPDPTTPTGGEDVDSGTTGSLEYLQSSSFFRKTR